MYVGSYLLIKEFESWITGVCSHVASLCDSSYYVVVIVCPLQPSSSVNSGCPGPESSILVSSRWACPISSQVTDQLGELCNRFDNVW